MRFFFAAAAALICTWSVASAQAPNSNVIRHGSMVSLEYTLTSDDGQFTESNKGKEPLRYVDGRDQIIPGLEKALEGLPAGAEKKVTVKPEDAYGQVDPKNFQEVPKENVPPDSLQVGTTLVAQNAQGQQFPVRVHEIREKTVVMDMNHPLAGKTLVFDVKILEVKPPEEQPAAPPAAGPRGQ